jgi:hypothetical protein
MECARLMLYELFLPALSAAPGIGKHPAASIHRQAYEGNSRRQARYYNKGFAHKDFAAWSW